MELILHTHENIVAYSKNSEISKIKITFYNHNLQTRDRIGDISINPCKNRRM